MEAQAWVVGREALGERGELVGAEMAVQGSTAEVMVGMAVSEAEATVKAVEAAVAEA